MKKKTKVGFVIGAVVIGLIVFVSKVLNDIFDYDNDINF